MSDESISILVVDDHPIYLDGISMMMQSLFPNAQVVQAQNGEQAKQIAAEQLDLDWIFIDYELPDSTGLQLIKALDELFVTAPLVLVTAHDDIGLVHQGMELGASGFIHKTHGKNAYLDCIGAVERGEVYLSSDLKAKLDHYRATVLLERDRILAQISERRRDVLLLLSEGYTNQEIARALGITESTVKSHVSALIGILESDNRSHCIAEARKLGLV